RQEFARLRQPIFPDAELYNAIADAGADIKEALGRAAREHKRVLLVFGGNWCYDCHVLEAAFHSPEVAPLLAPNFEVVNVDIGRADKNLDIAKKYQVPLEKGVPAIAVLESDGNLLFSQKNGEFEAVRKLGPEELIAFLNQWKPAAPPPRKP
ncbi:MAG TPA: thioredoxin family protein, partial [Candidatus Acidoferrales bacterium]|nr:thioredoxin family protein [Candidatus Acidoferrales bacterium]